MNYQNASMTDLNVKMNHQKSKVNHQNFKMNHRNAKVIHQNVNMTDWKWIVIGQVGKVICFSEFFATDSLIFLATNGTK